MSTKRQAAPKKTAPTARVTGPASYFPSIEKKYGKPIAAWKKLIRSRYPAKHMEIVSWLKSEHGMGHGHANALVGHTLAEDAAPQTTSGSKAKRTKKARGRDETSRDPAVDEYLADVSPKARALLGQLRETIHALVPRVEECISYKMPAFRHRGRIIAGFSATSKGCSYYPFSGTTLRTLARDIEGYTHTKSALHFGPDEPLPRSLVRKLLEARIAEIGRD